MAESGPNKIKTGDAPLIGAAGGAVGLGAAAAILGTCCVAPWAVGLIGVAGAVALARLTVLTPYLITGSVVLLGLAFFLAYRPRPVCAEETCEITSRRRLRWVAWGGAVLVVATLAIVLFPYL